VKRLERAKPLAGRKKDDPSQDVMLGTGEAWTMMMEMMEDVLRGLGSMKIDVGGQGDGGEMTTALRIFAQSGPGAVLQNFSGKNVRVASSEQDIQTGESM
jgi:hypothetical protein